MTESERIRAEFLKILETPRSGSKLARFEDWAATHKPSEVKHALRLLEKSKPVKAQRAKLFRVK